MGKQDGKKTSALTATAEYRDEALIAWHNFRIDPYERISLCGGREAELCWVAFSTKAFLPAIVSLFWYTLFVAPDSDAHTAPPAFRNSCRPFLHPECQFQFLRTYCHSASLLCPETPREFSRRFEHSISQIDAFWQVYLLDRLRYFYFALSLLSHITNSGALIW